MCFRQEATFGCGHNFITSLPCAQAEETGRCRPGSTTIVREDKGICPVCAEAAHERAEAEKEKKEDDDDDSDDSDDEGKGKDKGGRKPAFSGLTWEYTG
ncbi:hypothetical protein GRF29_1536g1313682 [Pseudopithomyces chartarum]|uniref:Uncharacterized protein n=1 Tax=Pseudopithomyces chartarum TaxID=1892770 RepID=A0AAN6LNR2_9PLEO|nr:hypothetical protein GRF29_1536g1313682 [Pseudopithomyces chartarum]